MRLLVAKGGALIGWGDGGTGAHGFGDDFELVGGVLVVLLVVLDSAVVFKEELAGLLEHPAALADRATDDRS